MDDAENAILQELQKIVMGNISNYEIEKVKNKFESVYQFGQLTSLNKAMDLAYHELLGEANKRNSEGEKDRKVSVNDSKWDSNGISLFAEVVT